MENAAREYPPRVEIINGKTFLMSPRPLIQHNVISSNIYFAFASYLRGKPCVPFSDGVDVHLDDKNWFIPDAMIVCNPDIIQADGIHGAPDLIVEVLSPSTMKNDRGLKMQAYARAGVREYWIVTPMGRSVEVYYNQRGIFVLDETYVECSELELSMMDDKERAAVKTEIKVSLYEDLFVNVADIFYRT